MEKLKKTEIAILAILWTLSLTTYSIAILNNYDLFTSDYLGLTGLTIVTSIAYFKPEKLFSSVLILLLLGLFNLISFAYFFNVVMSFGFSESFTPGIQLISLILICILVTVKSENVGEFYQATFGKSESEKEQSSKIAQVRFKKKFMGLTDSEIENKLKQDLVPEAISALEELKEERKNIIQNRTEL